MRSVAEGCKLRICIHVIDQYKTCYESLPKPLLLRLLANYFLDLVLVAILFAKKKND